LIDTTRDLLSNRNGSEPNCCDVAAVDTVYTVFYELDINHINSI